VVVRRWHRGGVAVVRRIDLPLDVVRVQTEDGPHPDDVQRQVNPADYGDAPTVPAPDDDGVYEGEVVDDDPAEVQELWFQVVAAAGARGLDMEQVEAGFARL